MNVLVDTCVWSLALRRKKNAQDAVVKELDELISEGRTQLIGPIRQELLSGIKNKKQFDALKDALRAFPDLALQVEDYECAAEFFTKCRQNGIQGSNTDFLICAAAYRMGMTIFTVDQDFALFREHLPLTLYKGRY